MPREIWRPGMEGLKRPRLLSDLLPGILDEFKDAIASNPTQSDEQLGSNLDIAIEDTKWVRKKIKFHRLRRRP